MLEQMNRELETVSDKLAQNQRILRDLNQAEDDRRFNWTFGILVTALIIALIILICI